MRLDRFLSECGCGTRSEVKKIIKNGCVKLNGETVKKADIQINEAEDEVTVNGNILIYNEFVYYMLNKPAGYVSATRDNRDRTVMELLEDEDKGEDIFPVGRLDKDTEGLLILSNDGKMAHNILSPKKHVKKTYFVRVDGKVKDEHIEMFRNGVDIGEKKPTLPAELRIIEAGDVSEVELTICEGKFHQVKRMFKVLGLEVIFLKRIKMGSLSLDENLKPGQYRRITDKELEMLCDIWKE